MEYIFTTDALPEGARQVCWQNEFLRVFQTDVRVERGAAPFNGEIRTRNLGPATLVNVQLAHEDERPHVIHYGPGGEARAGKPSIYVLAKLEGHTRYHYDGGSKRAGPGDVLLFDGGRSWAGESPRGRHQMLVLKLDRGALLPQLGVSALPVVCTLRAEQKLGGLVESYLRSLARLDARHARALGPRLIDHFQALLALAMQATLRGRGQAQAQARELQLQAIREYVEEHLGDTALSPESVAARFKISTRYLHKLYSEQGQSFSKWLLQRRLEQCRRDFDDPTLGQRSITDIALSRGFNDMTHFGRCFRAAYGLAPRDWRQFRPVRADLRTTPATARRANAAGRTRSVRISAPKRARATAIPDALRWLSDEQIESVRVQFESVASAGDEFVAAFYDRLFEYAPQVRALFRSDMGEQGAKLLRMLALLVAKAEAPGELLEPLAQLGERHRGYGAMPEHIAPLQRALIDSLAERLGPAFDADAREAWVTLLQRAVQAMWKPQQS